MHLAAHPTIALLQSQSLATAVLQSLEQSILAGRFEPGAKLNEAELARQLGVSRGPVREAFRLLEDSGLVRTEKNRGVFVRSLTTDEAAEVFDVRAALEEWVGRQLASRITAAQIAALNAVLADMTQAIAAQDARTYYALNLQFHDTLVLMTGNQRLLNLYRKLIKELSLFRRRNLSQVDALPASVQGHRQIVEALARADAEAAAKAMSGHVLDSKQRSLGTPAMQQDDHPAETFQKPGPPDVPSGIDPGSGD